MAHFGNTNVPAEGEDDDDDSDDDEYVPSEHDDTSDADALDSSGQDESGGEESEERGEKRKTDSLESSPRKKTNAEIAAEEAQRSALIWEQFKSAVKQQRSPEKPPKEESKLAEEPTKKEEVKHSSPSENVVKQTSSEIVAETRTKLTTPSTSSIDAQIKTKVAAPLPAFGKQQPKPGISPASSSRLGSILSQIGQQKKSKSILEQSKEHWESFKKDEGISEELAIHNRGSKGYLDRQDFLARVDSRQDEQLRQLRLQLMNKRRTT